VPNNFQSVEGVFYQGVMNLNESRTIEKLHDVLEERLNKETEQTIESRSESLYSVDFE
jgi:hypothetical protein